MSKPTFVIDQEVAWLRERVEKLEDLVKTFATRAELEQEKKDREQRAWEEYMGADL